MKPDHHRPSVKKPAGAPLSGHPIVGVKGPARVTIDGGLDPLKESEGTLRPGKAGGTTIEFNVDVEPNEGWRPYGRDNMGLQKEITVIHVKLLPGVIVFRSGLTADQKQKTIEHERGHATVTRQFFTAERMGRFLQSRSDLLAPVVGKDFKEFEARINARRDAIRSAIDAELNRLQDEFHKQNGHTL